MRFDWQQFCTRHRVQFVTSGPNTARGNISIKCPFCGDTDPSEHMGLSLDVYGPSWGCLRNHTHRGRNPTRLISRLLRISYAVAESMVSTGAPLQDGFDAAVNKLRGGHSIIQPQALSKLLRFPKEFRPIADGGAYAQRFEDYLLFRGFTLDVMDYELYYCLVGDFQWRLIFPIYSAGRGLVGWTGRDIRHGATLRYRASDGLGKVLLSFTQTPEETLVVCEGPMDALKLDLFGRLYKVRAVATLGTGMTDAQMIDLTLFCRGYGQVKVALDADAMATGLRLAGALPNVQWVPMPNGVKDPGEMSPDVADEFCRKLALR